MRRTAPFPKLGLRAAEYTRLSSVASARINRHESEVARARREAAGETLPSQWRSHMVTSHVSGRTRGDLAWVDWLKRR